MVAHRPDALPSPRLVRHDDAAELARLYRRQRAYLTPWEPDRADRFFTEEGQLAEIDAVLSRHAREEALPLVVAHPDGSLIGRVTLSGIVRGAFQSCSVGYWIAEEHTGRGHATRALRWAVTAAFEELGLHRVQAEAVPENLASHRVLAKAGFRRIGLAPQYLHIDGAWRDHIIYQKLRDGR